VILPLPSYSSTFVQSSTPIAAPPLPPTGLEKSLLNSNSRSYKNLNAGQPPPPPPPPSGPAPLPPPPLGGWNTVYQAARKPQVHPKCSMKPLFWNRIQLPKEEVDGLNVNKQSLWEDLEEEKPEDWKEFEELFSRQMIQRKKTSNDNKDKTKVVTRANLLDSKRAHNVNILVTSLRLEIAEIENAIYTFDTSVVDTEKLQKIFEMYPTQEELSKIQNHLKENPEVLLGKPEQFLYDISRICCFPERVSCLMFEIQFSETISSIETRLNNFKNTCNYLMTNRNLKNIFAIILSLGNYMNGGNRDRGQADGFGLEILPKLKEVKSTTDCSITLLHYVIKIYFDKYISTEQILNQKLRLPISEPQDLQRASVVTFDNIASEIQNLKSSLDSVECKIKKVISSESNESHIEPFKSRMESFLERAFSLQKEQEDNLQECRNMYALSIINLNVYIISFCIQLFF